jgi:hypothetical protein
MNTTICDDERKSEPQPIGAILKELLTQYETEFPDINITVVGTATTTRIITLVSAGRCQMEAKLPICRRHLIPRGVFASSRLTTPNDVYCVRTYSPTTYAVTPQSRNDACLLQQASIIP